MLAILAWTLGLPTVVTIVAIAWVHWASRPRGPVATHESLAAYERFKAAIEGSSANGRRTS